MKKIIRPAVVEKAEHICDVCHKPAVSHFEIGFGYNSDHFGGYIEGDFCNKHGNEFRRYLLKKYKGLKKETYYI